MVSPSTFIVHRIARSGIARNVTSPSQRQDFGAAHERIINAGLREIAPYSEEVLKGLRWGLLVSIIVTTGCKGRRTAPPKPPATEVPAPEPEPTPTPEPEPTPTPPTPPPLGTPFIQINSGADFTNSTNVVVDLAADSAVDMYVTNNAGCLTGGQWKPLASSFAWTLSTPNATNRVYAKLRAADGTESPCVNDSIVHDNLAPAVAITSPAAGARIDATNVAHFTVSGTCGENGRNVALTADGSISGGALCTSGAWTYSFDFTSLPDGTVSVRADHADAAGNSSSSTRAFTKDATVPTNASVTIAAGAAYTTTTAVSLTLQADNAAEMYVTNLAGCTAGGTWQASTTTKSWGLLQTEGTATVYARFRTSTGNLGACVSDTIVHDSVAPTWTDTPVHATAYNSATTTPVIAWSANAADAVSGVEKYQYALGTGSAGAAQTSLATWTDVAQGSFSHTGLTLAHGSNYYVTMRVLDRAGNATTRPSSSWAVDLVAPVLTMSSPAAGSVTTDPDVALVGTCEASLPLQVSYAAGLTGPASANCSNGTYSVVAQNATSSGVRGVTVTEQDGAGNVTTLGRTFQYAQSIETNGQVLTMIVDSDGARYIGGNFTHVATSREPYFVKLTASGAKSSDFTLGSGFNGQVKGAARLNDGSLIVVGDFTRYRGQVANRVAKIDATGTLDTTFNPQTGANGANATVSAVAVTGNSIFLGGAFTQYRGTTANYVTRLDLTGAKDATFSPTSGANGTNAAVNALATDGLSLFMGGAFTQYRGGAANRLAEVTLDGALDTTFNPASGGNGASDVVNALATDGASLFVGGAFTQIRGATANRLAKVDLAGSLDTTFNPAIGFNGTNNTVNSLSLDGSYLYAGGAFTQYRSTAANYLLKVDLDGAKDTTFNPNSGVNGVNGAVNSVFASGGVVYAGGAFTLYRNGTALRLVKASAAGVLDTTFNPATGANGADNLVYTIVGHADGIYAGGAFGHYRPAYAVNYVARIKPDGTLDTSFSPTAGTGGTNNVVRALALQGSTLYIGGDFTQYRSTAANRVTKVDKYSGTKDATFSPNSGANGVNSSVYALAADDTYVYVGGTFTQYRGSNANYITKLDGSGGQDNTFGRSNGTSSSVYALLLRGDALYLGGAFTQYRSAAANRVTKVDKTSGDKDDTFSPNSGANGTNSLVYALAASGSHLYLGGSFTSYRGTAANYVTKVDLASGVKDTTFSPASGANGASTQVNSLAFVGTSLYVGGNFTLYRGAAANYVARVSEVGTLDTTFNPAADFNGTNGSVDVIVPDGAKIWLGGAFTLYRNGGAFYTVPVTSAGVVSP